MIRKDHVLDTTFDGIIGLAYPCMSGFKGLPLFDSMMQQKLLLRNVFAFYMSLNKYEQSELIFGWIDDTKYSGDLVWHDVVF